MIFNGRMGEEQLDGQQMKTQKKKLALSSVRIIHLGIIRYTYTHRIHVCYIYGDIYHLPSIYHQDI